MDLVQWAQKTQGYVEGLEKTIKELHTDILECQNQSALYSQVRDLFASVGKATQEQLIGYFEKLGTSMLQTIYGEEYRFVLKFEMKRNKSECAPKVWKGDLELDLKDDTGVGVVDVLSFAMRLAVWSLSRPRTEPVFILDEPFKYVSEDKLKLVGNALQELVETLGVQIIMVSHDEELIEAANTAHRVIIHDGISEVRRER